MAELTQSDLKALLSYDPDTGIFIRNVFSGGQKVGNIAGSNHCAGYKQITLLKQKYLMHRLAWLYVYGETPKEEIDHINGDRSDNRICNLRLATNKQNRENQALQPKNTSGFRGVSWSKKSQRWRADVTHNGKACWLGLFNSVEEAAAAAKGARDLLFTHHNTTHSA